MRWARKFPECKPVIPRLQNLGAGTSVEQELERLQIDQRIGGEERSRQLTALRFYLQSMVYFVGRDWDNLGEQITNYKTLLDDILSWRKGDSTLLVTFNYDLMIDKALEDRKVGLSTLPDYIKDERFKLIKLHGSVDWVRLVEAPPIDTNIRDHDEIAKEVILRAPYIKVGPYLKVDGSPPHGFALYKIGGDPAVSAAYPAIAIPIENKEDFECPLEHLDALKSLLPRVTKILVIGWRGVEKHFRRLLDELRDNVEVMVVSPGEADQTIARMREVKTVSQAEFKPINKGFTEFIRSRAGEAFLRD
jgi:hypothetical protein